MQSINDINFIEPGGRYGKQTGIFMPGGYWVPQIEVILAWELTIANLPAIDWAEKVCTETIMHPEIWRGFDHPMRFRLGRCLTFFCKHKMLPIEIANPLKKGKRFYKRKEI